MRPVRWLALAGSLVLLSACQSLPDREQPSPARADAPAGSPGAGEHIAPAVATEGSSRRKRSGRSRRPAAASAVPDAADVDVSPDLWSRLRAGFRFADCEHESSMRASLRGFTAHPVAFESMMRRAVPHLDYVAHRLERAGLPLEFALLPMVESRYQWAALRPGTPRPAGPWQLAPGTARAAGIKVAATLDQRFDLVASTDAAIRLLESLHRQFEDWTLVNLAFNAGDGRVRGALRRSGGWQGDAYALPLSPITRAHYSRLRALVCICKDPDRYGMALPPASSAPQRVEVSTTAIAASEAGASAATSSVASPQFHRVVSGDSLWRIARRYGIAMLDLKRWNAVGTGSILRPGQMLRLRAP